MLNLWSFDASLMFSVFVHEAGHLLMAQVLGVRIERFRLGFGPLLLRMGRFELRLVPISGEVRTGEVREPWKGVLIALSGVFMQWIVIVGAMMTGIARDDVVFWAWVLGLAMVSVLNWIPIGNTDGAVALKWVKNSHSPSIE